MPNNNDDFKLENLYNVKNEVAVVTGGGSGVGLMAAQALAVNGAKVYLIGRSEAKLKRAIEAHEQGISGQMIALQGDVANKDEIRRLVEEIQSRETFVSILINNAGIAGAYQAPKGSTAEELRQSLFEPENATFEDWANTYRTNTAQCYFMTTAFLPLLQRSNEIHHGWSSTVINIGSMSGIVQNSQDHFSYNASKAAQHYLSTILAAEVTKHGLRIRINCIAPGVFPSEITAGGSNETGKSDLSKDAAGPLPAGRIGDDRDMGNAILFAATNQYLYGQTIAVDGGYLLSVAT